MRRTMERMILRYGSAMVLSGSSGEHQIRAFLQETQSKGLNHISREIEPLGEIPKGIYVYIGPADPAAEAGDTLRFRDKTYEFRRTEQVTVADTEIYCWGLCVQKGSDGTWGD